MYDEPGTSLYEEGKIEVGVEVEIVAALIDERRDPQVVDGTEKQVVDRFDLTFSKFFHERLYPTQVIIILVILVPVEQYGERVVTL